VNPIIAVKLQHAAAGVKDYTAIRSKDREREREREKKKKEEEEKNSD